jgi:excisionase family DNA binding protein
LRRFQVNNPKIADGMTRNSTATVDRTYLTSPEVCALLRTSIKTLQRWRKAGNISYTRLGGRILYSRTAIEKFIAARTVKSA